MGFCQKEPLVNIMKPGWPRIVYSQIGPAYAKKILNTMVEGKIIPERALCQVTEEANLVENSTIRYPFAGLPDGLEHVPHFDHIPFFAPQNRRILRNCGLIDPDSI